jgi:hypothetical protein
MKNLFGASFALASLAGSLLAIPAVYAAEKSMETEPAEACSVDTMDDVMALHLKLDGIKGDSDIVTVTMTPASDREVKFGWDIRHTETRRVVKPKAGHAINSKGTGGNRTSAPEGEPALSKNCAAGKHFKDATLADARAGNSASFTVVKTQSTTRNAMVTTNPNANEASCALSGDPANPTLTVQLSGNDVSANGEVDLYFIKEPITGSSCDISRGFTPRKNPT